jgi:1-pyrroline-5-carboxylate dehydrogenase
MATTEVQVTRGEFVNEPFTDFSKPENRKAQEDALAQVRAQFNQVYPLWINGEKVETGDFLKSMNPSRPAEVVGAFHKANLEIANRAVESAHATFDRWKRVPAAERSEILFRCADILRRRRFELNAWVIYEVGKTWPEADADIAETIDFCEFYGRENLRVTQPTPTLQIKGEKSYQVFIPLGVGVIIPPWNFPCAIMAGLTLASIVVGNTVVLKPSSDSPTIAYKFLECLWEAGLPKDVINFCPGPGASVGDTLVKHPKTRYIGFTGSKEAGLHIHEQASKTQPGQIWIKRTILEMGGKDAIIVDDEADLDAAVEGVTISAFGYQGQKCSACSRAIVTEKVYDAFLEKLKARVEKITVGPADDPNNLMGPVINKKSMEDILGYIEHGKKDGRLLTGGSAIQHPSGGWYLQPTVFADIPPLSKLEQEEIFGPVLAVIKARDFDHALEIANDTEFGLTGGVYSKNRQKLDRAAVDFHVGNLYFNRKCTGALVGAHPFGGFNMSGTDSKTGGKEYLLLFTQAKVVAEKIAS